jgi:hypothetical protein
MELDSGSSDDIETGEGSMLQDGITHDKENLPHVPLVEAKRAFEGACNVATVKDGEN